ncbi:MAG: peptidylprolyl isomerase [Spirochaetaceae bacterium]|nr:MAG: peptidylprolyl isomerase [Spirochaetaceae bacterium]
MTVEKNKVVEIDYTLKDNSGQLIDSSEGREPLSYIQGTGNLIPGVEDALEGKSAGDRVEVTVPPETGYGVRDESLVLAMDRSQFTEVDDLKAGLRFRMETPDGSGVFTVVKIEESKVHVDGNHPLAGMTLDFDITVQSVRDATPEELDHGHVHE